VSPVHTQHQLLAVCGCCCLLPGALHVLLLLLHASGAAVWGLQKVWGGPSSAWLLLLLLLLLPGRLLGLAPLANALQHHLGMVLPSRVQGTTRETLFWPQSKGPMRGAAGHLTLSRHDLAMQRPLHGTP
jgi:hypothetical protein